jgi:hypothetical protein
MDICELPPETGPCDAAIRRYFHNATSQQCERFTYGGCGGNENNFKTLRECEDECEKEGEALILKRVRQLTSVLYFVQTFALCLLKGDHAEDISLGSFTMSYLGSVRGSCTVVAMEMTTTSGPSMSVK